MSESNRKKLRITPVSPTSSDRQLAVAQVTPIKRNCNYCDERLQKDYCECWKARYKTKCKNCRKPIYEDDCLEVGTSNHTQCPRSIAREDYSPRSLILSHGKRQPDQNYCKKKLRYGKCDCYPARMRQKCQSCSKQIEKGDCIHAHNCGWCHVLCPGEEENRLLAIVSDFRKDVNLYKQLESSEPKCKPRILAHEFYASDCSSDDDESTSSELNVTTEYEFKEKLTEEQKAILSHRPDRGDIVCINALAGCGKTTVIAALCNQIRNYSPFDHILYLVYNKANQLEAQVSSKFPKENMEIRTIHSFVLRHYFTKDYMNDVKPIEKLSLDDISDTLYLEVALRRYFPELYSNESRRKQNRRLNQIAGYIRRTLENFMASSDRECLQDHVAYNSSSFSHRTIWKNKISESQYQRWAQEFFNELQDRCRAVRAGTMKGHGITHDTYVKVAQIERMDIDFGFVLVDEAQDMSKCQADLIWGSGSNVQNRITYLVGDIYQQIYRFRGADSSFKDTAERSKKKFHLSGSFRFGNNIAALASIILSARKGPELFGRADLDGDIYNTTMPRGLVLCRSNVGMFTYLFENKPKRWCYLDGLVKKHRLQPKPWQLQLENFFVDKEGDDSESDSESRTFEYKGEQFSDINDMKEYARDEGDIELSKAMHLVSYLQEHGKTLQDFYDTIAASFVPLKEDEDVNEYNGIVLGTVHKAKGLEFDNVFIHHDFNWEQLEKSLDEKQEYSNFDEANILYVAITRATKRLYLADKVKDFFNKLGKTKKKKQPFFFNSMAMKELRLKWRYEWNKFQQIDSTIDSLNDVVWPPNWNDPSSYFAIDRDILEQEFRDFTRLIRISYHPDKFIPRFRRLISKPNVEDEIKKRLEDVMRNCQKVIELKHLFVSEG